MSDVENLIDNRKAKKVARRSNVERSAATREKVIGAAVQCLNDLGYEGTTVILVARKAGVSRGAAQHQFPSKVDLMVATAEAVVKHQNTKRTETWNKLNENMENLPDVVDFSWSLQSDPENVALMEIMLATRNDADLKERCKPFFEHLEALRKTSASAIANYIGAEPDNKELLAMIRLHYAAMRGLAIDALMTGDDASIRDAVNILKRAEGKIVDGIVKKVAEKNNRQD